MDIRVFDLPEAGAPTFRQMGRVREYGSANYKERLFQAGTFTVTVPVGAAHADRLSVGRLVYMDGFWGIIDDLDAQAGSGGLVLTLAGRELKGITEDRITIPPSFSAVTGAQGYDAFSGTTEAVMKHFADANLGPGAVAARRVLGLTIAQDRGRGLAQDKYMSRHDVLADVLADLGEASGLGYGIVPDLERHQLVFDVIEGLDHTAGQRDRTRVILDVGRKTALEQSYAHHTADARNLFYATLAGSEFADEALTVTYLRDGEEEAVGIRRREKHLSISADTPAAGQEYDELKRLALIEAETCRPAESFACSVAEGPYVYRADYALGDRVTVRNQALGVTMDAQLTEMETAWTSSGVKHTATFGTAPVSVFGRLARQIRKGK